MVRTLLAVFPAWWRGLTDRLPWNLRKNWFRVLNDFFALLKGARIRILWSWNCRISSVNCCFTTTFKVHFHISAACNSATTGRINIYKSLVTESVNSSCFFFFIFTLLFLLFLPFVCLFPLKCVLCLLFYFGCSPVLKSLQCEIPLSAILPARSAVLKNIWKPESQLCSHGEGGMRIKRDLCTSAASS